MSQGGVQSAPSGDPAGAATPMRSGRSLPQEMIS